LINVNALFNNGRKSDLKKAYEYLRNFIADHSLHKEKITDSFYKAF